MKIVINSILTRTSKFYDSQLLTNQFGFVTSQDTGVVAERLRHRFCDQNVPSSW